MWLTEKAQSITDVTAQSRYLGKQKHTEKMLEGDETQSPIQYMSSIFFCISPLLSVEGGSAGVTLSPGRSSEGKLGQLSRLTSETDKRLYKQI